MINFDLIFQGLSKGVIGLEMLFPGDKIQGN